MRAVTGPTRRDVLGWGVLGVGAAAGVVGTGVPVVSPAAATETTSMSNALVRGATGVGAQPPILPREAWAAGLPTPRALPLEEDVRFLLVHHTQTPNGESPEGVRRRLRSVHAFHTGEKGWPDVAYNFFVDGHGRIWEGRAGSIEAPVRGDATGGNQGHALLCCFVGDHTRVPPTPAAQEAMGSLLGWLATRHGIDLAAREVTFVSRGSNRWPAGTQVRTAPISGHRDVSLTECPGDAAYALVHGTLLTRARAAASPPRPPAPAAGTVTTAGTASAAASPRAGAAPTATSPSANGSLGGVGPTPGPPTAPVTAVPTSAATAPAPTDGAAPVAAGRPLVEDATARGWWAALGGAVLAGGVALAARRRPHGREPMSEPGRSAREGDGLAPTPHPEVPGPRASVTQPGSGPSAAPGAPTAVEDGRPGDAAGTAASEDVTGSASPTSASGGRGAPSSAVDPPRPGSP